MGGANTLHICTYIAACYLGQAPNNSACHQSIRCKLTGRCGAWLGIPHVDFVFQAAMLAYVCMSIHCLWHQVWASECGDACRRKLVDQSDRDKGSVSQAVANDTTTQTNDVTTETSHRGILLPPYNSYHAACFMLQLFSNYAGAMVCVPWRSSPRVPTLWSMLGR